MASGLSILYSIDLLKIHLLDLFSPKAKNFIEKFYHSSHQL